MHRFSILFINLIPLIILSIMFSNISILIFGIIGLILVIVCAKDEENKLYKHLSFIFLLSLLFMLILYYGYILEYDQPYFLGNSDDYSFEEWAKYAIKNNIYLPNQMVNDNTLIYNNSKGFIWILSWIMRVSEIFGGYHTITYRILNICFMILLSLLAYKYFKRHENYNYKQNLVLLYIIALFPNALFVSSHVFRDTLSSLLIFSVFYLWDLFLQNRKHILLVISVTIIFSYTAYWIRSFNIYFIIFFVAINIIMSNKKISYKRLGIFFILFAISLFAINFTDIWKLFKIYNNIYDEYFKATNSGLSILIFSIPILPFGIVLRVLYGMIYPLPVGLLNIFKMFEGIDIFTNVFTSFGTVLQIFMLPYLFKNSKQIDKVAIAYIILYGSIISTTFGFRHFIMLYPFMFILIARQFYKTNKLSKILWFFLIIGLLLIAGILYNLLKFGN